MREHRPACSGITVGGGTWPGGRKLTLLYTLWLLITMLDYLGPS